MDFYSTLIACRTRLKIKGEECKDNKIVLKDLDSGFPSYPESSKERVGTPNQKGYTQMDGPEEATRESAWPGTQLRPRKCGPSRVSAAIWMRPSNSFRRGVVPGLYFLLHL